MCTTNCCCNFEAVQGNWEFRAEKRIRTTKENNDCRKSLQRLQCLRNRYKTSVELKAVFYRARRTEISSRTVRRRLVKIRLRARRPVVKSALTASARRKHLSWAREHINWTDEMWDSVIFSDESKFKLHESDGRLFVRRKAGKRLSGDCLQMMPPTTEE